MNYTKLQEGKQGDGREKRERKAGRQEDKDTRFGPSKKRGDKTGQDEGNKGSRLKIRRRKGKGRTEGKESQERRERKGKRKESIIDKERNGSRQREEKRKGKKASQKERKKRLGKI